MITMCPRPKAYQLGMIAKLRWPGRLRSVVSGDSGRSGHPVDDRGAVVGVAAVAAVASYEHTYALVRAHGEAA